MNFLCQFSILKYLFHIKFWFISWCLDALVRAQLCLYVGYIFWYPMNGCLIYKIGSWGQWTFNRYGFTYRQVVNNFNCNYGAFKKNTWMSCDHKHDTVITFSVSGLSETVKDIWRALLNLSRQIGDALLSLSLQVSCVEHEQKSAISSKHLNNLIFLMIYLNSACNMHSKEFKQRDIDTAVLTIVL